MSDGRIGVVRYIPPNDLNHPIINCNHDVSQTDDNGIASALQIRQENRFCINKNLFTRKLVRRFIIYRLCFRQVLISSEALLIGFMWKVSVRYCSTFGLMKAGSVGPK